MMIKIKGSLLCVATLLFSACSFFDKQQNVEPSLTIGILQTASHPALDAAREGFEEQVKKLVTDKPVKFVVLNGQGSIAQLQSMAQSLHANSQVNAIFAIATPAAQAIRHVEKTKPIIIAAVTDPHAAGLIQPGGNVCGMKDMIDVESTVDLVKKLAPSAQRVGLVFNPGEINSSVMVKILEKAFEDLGVQVLLVGIMSEAEVPAAITMACKNVDVLLAPTDNMVALTLPLIAERALQAKKPFIISDNELVKQGALAACGIDYRASGEYNAAIAMRVLNENIKPCDIEIAIPHCDTIVLNRKIVERLGIEIPAFTKKLQLIE